MTSVADKEQIFCRLYLIETPEAGVTKQTTKSTDRCDALSQRTLVLILCCVMVIRI